MFFSELEEIIQPLYAKNIEKHTFFDYFRISGIKEDPEEDMRKNYVYFPIYCLNTEGWYIEDIDERSKLPNRILKYPYNYYVIEPSMEFLMSSRMRYIVVRDIMEAVNALFIFKLRAFRGKTIIVTGSVGKTTTVGLLEKMISEHVLRIYSKRITPLVLQSYIINFLNNECEYIVLEAAMYYKHHVEYFSKVLNPYLGIILNINEEHLGIDNIESSEDVLKSKLKLLRYAEIGLINGFDPMLSRVKFEYNNLTYNNTIRLTTTRLKSLYILDKLKNGITPYINTELSYIQYNIAYAVGSILGLNETQTLGRINDYIPVENRILKKQLLDHTIIFDGDISGVERLRHFTTHLYKKAILVIRYLVFNGEENEDFSKIVEYFSKFEKIYITNTVRYVELFNNQLNVTFFDDHAFLKVLGKDYQVFYHYGGYYRKYEFFDEATILNEVII